MYKPIVIIGNSFQHVYFDSVEFLSKNHWEYYNMIVQIKDPLEFNNTINKRFTIFSHQINIKTPKIVSSTIFPDGMYQLVNSRYHLYEKYLNRLYPKAKKGRWGTYFQRMINYNQNNNSVNQLENIIQKIIARKTYSKAAYTIYIQYPGKETILKMGGPCLNYIAVQIESKDNPKLGLLAVYRNHDFLERAYGNYLGLCNLVKFLSLETNLEAGSLTCVSSHAFIVKKRKELLGLIIDIKNGIL